MKITIKDKNIVTKQKPQLVYRMSSENPMDDNVDDMAFYGVIETTIPIFCNASYRRLDTYLERMKDIYLQWNGCQKYYRSTRTEYVFSVEDKYVDMFYIFKKYGMIYTGTGIFNIDIEWIDDTTLADAIENDPYAINKYHDTKQALKDLCDAEWAKYLI
jgi:hypothetical protein